jgi:hypothetical protein
VVEERAAGAAALAGRIDGDGVDVPEAVALGGSAVVLREGTVGSGA